MRKFRFGKVKSAILAAIISTLFSYVFAGNPHIESVTMSPTNPAFGDAFQVVVTYCGQMYGDHELAIAVSSMAARDNADVSGTGQVFVVSRAGIDVATSQPATSPGGEIGWTAQLNPNGGTANCPTCGSGSNDGTRFTKTYNVHVPPATYFPGCNVTNLYLHVGMKDANLNAGEWQGLAACQVNPAVITWPIGTETKNYSLSKRVEGVLQNTNDLVLYSIDYEYWNGQLTITDNIPGAGNLTLVSWGPQSFTGATISGPAVGVTAGAFSWGLPNRTGQAGRATGTVWMLLRMNNNVTAGTAFSNLATGVMSGVTNKTARANIVVGQAAVTITKDQSESNPMVNDLITYYLTYQVNGSKLVGYQPFDDIPLGDYGDLAGLGGTPPPGWVFSPQAGVNGQWRIQDSCNTGDRTIRGDATNTDRFPSLLFSGLPATNHMCKGIVMADVLIEPGGYEGGDALVVIRSDGLTNGSTYGLVVSVDDFIGTNSTGNIGFQRCDGVTGCIWPLSSNSVAITANKWWRVKIEAGYPPANNQYAFRAKVWAKGDPEPGWTISWTDPAPPASFDCNNGQAWKPGIAEQHGATGDVSDHYNNFIVYEPRVSADTVVWDTIPNGSNGDITYLGQQGPAGHSYIGNAAVARWDLGSISDEGGTFTWWGRVNTCDPITNDAWINGAAPMVANRSNQVIAIPICPEVTGITKTANVTQAGMGSIITWTITYCNNGVGDIANYVITDPMPSGMSYLGCSGGACSQAAGVVTWNLGLVPVGTCNQVVRWWGAVTAIPSNPFGEKEMFAFIPDTKALVEKEYIMAMAGEIK